MPIIRRLQPVVRVKVGAERGRWLQQRRSKDQAKRNIPCCTENPAPLRWGPCSLYADTVRKIIVYHAATEYGFASSKGIDWQRKPVHVMVPFFLSTTTSRISGHGHGHGQGHGANACAICRSLSPNPSDPGHLSTEGEPVSGDLHCAALHRTLKGRLFKYFHVYCMWLAEVGHGSPDRRRHTL